MGLDDLGGWPGVLTRVARGNPLSVAEAEAVMRDVLDGNAGTAQLAAFVFALRCRGETVEEMNGFLRAMLAVAGPVPLPDGLASRVIDTCGTGGDRRGTINVSTVAALVVAAAGVPVCKHGGRAASSRAGSADLLEALGVAIDLDGTGVARCITEVGIGFCFAPKFHASMRYAGPVRAELAVPTVFNFLGPLANPGRVRRQVVGVGDPSMADKMASVLAAGGSEHVAVVYGHDGLDELSTTTSSTMVTWSAAEGERRATNVDPGALGLAPADLDDLRGGDADTNALFTRRVLDGETGPHRDIVLLNAAAGLLVGGRVADLAEGLAVAAAAVDDGHAAQTLERLIVVSQKARG